MSDTSGDGAAPLNAGQVGQAVAAYFQALQDRVDDLETKATPEPYDDTELRAQVADLQGFVDAIAHALKLGYLHDADGQPLLDEAGARLIG